MPMVRTLAPAAVVVLGVAATAWLVVERGAQGDPVEADLGVVTAAVERQDLRDVVVLRGVLEGRPLPDLVSVGDGRVTNVQVAVGSVVETGDALVDINGEPVIAVAGDMPYWRDLDEGATGPDVAQLRAMLDGQGFSPGASGDRFTAGTKDAVQAWQREHGLPDSGVFRADRVLVAPWPARVTNVGIAVGRSVAPDAELFSIVSTERVANFTVSGTERPRLEEGQLVEVVPAAGGPAMAASITAVATAPTVDPELGEPRYPVEVTLDEDPTELAEGAALRGDVVVAEAADVLVVPVVAVQLAADGNTVVTVVDGDTMQQVPVVLGLQHAGVVEVASGLTEGERVVLELD